MNRLEARILLVDESGSMRDSIRALLSAMGFSHIAEAADGQEGLMLFRRYPYDAVLTDWHLPRLSGRELLRAIRRGALREATPVLVLTGTATRDCLREAIAAGATGFLAKPILSPSLIHRPS